MKILIQVSDDWDSGSKEVNILARDINEAIQISLDKLRPEHGTPYTVTILGDTKLLMEV